MDYIAEFGKDLLIDYTHVYHVIDYFNDMLSIYNRIP